MSRIHLHIAVEDIDRTTRSDNDWVQDPQGVAWETFYTLDSVPTFGDAEPSDLAAGACRVPVSPASSLRVAPGKPSEPCC
jgi:hypothetical protein